METREKAAGTERTSYFRLLGCDKWAKGPVPVSFTDQVNLLDEFLSVFIRVYLWPISGLDIERTRKKDLATDKHG